MNSMSGFELRRKVGPLLIWLVCAGAAAWIYTDLKVGTTIIGFAYGAEYPVAPLETARVASVAVEVGEEVSRGQVLALLETSQIEREIRVFEASIAEIEAELTAAIHFARRQVVDRQRALSQQRARIAARLAEARGQAMAASAELRAQRIERGRLRALVDARLTERGPLAAVESRIALLKGRVNGARQSVALLEEQVAEAQSYIETTTDEHVEVEVGPMRRRLERANTQLEGLRARRTGLVLRAPADGRVAAVELQAGGIADANSPVVTLVGDGGGRVVACITEEQALDVSVGDRAYLHIRQVGAERLSGQVIGLGPLVDRLPSRCRPNVGERAWGRDVVIQVDGATTFLPGQALDVLLESQGTEGEAKAQAKRGAPDRVRPIKVPDSLSTRSRIEASALVWEPRLSRYLVVSDDTGLAGESEDVPWLFTMDKEGQMDPNPLVLGGLESVKDLEGAALGADEALYLLSSQSHSKKGKRPRAREHFIRLTPEGNGYGKARHVTLASLIDGMPTEGRRALGIEDTSELDLEGLCVHKGALLIGVKHPLTAEGHAMIWRMAKPERLFTTGQLEDAQLELWAHVALSVKADDAKVAGGISELLSMPDGTLLIAATVPRAKPERQDGALWWAQDPSGGELEVSEVRTFEGLKPEGLALSPTPGRFVITFDSGPDTPLWAELPWPRS